MKTNNAWAVLAVMGWMAGWMACGGTTAVTPTPGPGSNVREAAVSEASGANCATYARCEQVGSGKQYASLQDCVTDRAQFWNDRWAADRCEGKINSSQVQSCLEALQTISCNSLIDELKVINTKCAQEDVCSGNQ